MMGMSINSPSKATGRSQWKFSIMGAIGTSETVLYMEVSLIQRLSNTVIH